MIFYHEGKTTMFALTSNTYVDGTKVPPHTGTEANQVMAAQRFINAGYSPIEVIGTWGNILSQTAFGREYLESFDLETQVRSELAENDPLLVWSAYSDLCGAFEFMADVAWELLRRIQAKIYTYQVFALDKNRRKFVSSQKQDISPYRPVTLYRLYGHTLREIMEKVPDCNIAAQDLLMDLQLSASLPGNDLESSPELDSYTLEPVVDPWVEMLESEDPIDELIDSTSIELEKPQKPAFLSPWQHYLSTRKPYADNEMNLAFELASGEDFTGLDTPDLYDDEQKPEDLPVYMQPDGFDEELEGLFHSGVEWNAILDARQLRDEMWGWYDENKDGLSKAKKKVFFDRMRIHMWRHVRMVKDMPLDTQAFVIWKLANKTTPVKYLVRACHNPVAVAKFINSYSALLEEYNRSGDANRYELSEFQIGKVSKQLVGQSLSAFPEYGDPKETRIWNEAYIRAISNGANFAQARDAAWAAHRMSISPLGAQAFNLAQGRMREKWGTFHKVAIANGDEWKIVVAVLPDGIITANHHNPTDTWKMNWSYAANFFSKGQLEMKDNQIMQIIRTGANKLSALVAEMMIAPQPTNIL
jgi:hypothetical protein